MGAEFPGILRLRCSVKRYEWGKAGEESGVARLYAYNSGEEIDGDEPFAEFWMGTHESSPSTVVASCQSRNGGVEKGGGLKRNHCNPLSLKDWVKQNPSVLGDKVFQRWGPNLPFLFKVLSVAKALSIQAHPDKSLAAMLHKQQPEVYKDDNHKPEMALALTEFEALCGFVGLEKSSTDFTLASWMASHSGIMSIRMHDLFVIMSGDACYPLKSMIRVS